MAYSVTLTNREAGLIVTALEVYNHSNNDASLETLKSGLVRRLRESRARESLYDRATRTIYRLASQCSQPDPTTASEEVAVTYTSPDKVPRLEFCSCPAILSVKDCFPRMMLGYDLELSSKLSRGEYSSFDLTKRGLNGEQLNTITLWPSEAELFAAFYLYHAKRERGL